MDRGRGVYNAVDKGYRDKISKSYSQSNKEYSEEQTARERDSINRPEAAGDEHICSE